MNQLADRLLIRVGVIVYRSGVRFLPVVCMWRYNLYDIGPNP